MAQGSAATVEDAGDVEAECAVGVDGLEVGGAEVGDGVGADLVTVGPVGVDGVLQEAGGGQDAGVDDQGVAVGLGGLVVVVGVADGTAVGEEGPPLRKLAPTDK